jgi:hypothetical protein
MSKRPSAIFAVLAALSLGTPAVMADHGHGDSKNDHGNKHSDSDDDRGWGLMVAATGGLRDGVVEENRLGKLRSTSRPTQEVRLPELHLSGRSGSSKGRSLFDAH